jgi:hypothetical protein
MWKLNQQTININGNNVGNSNLKLVQVRANLRDLFLEAGDRRLNAPIQGIQIKSHKIEHDRGYDLFDLGWVPRRGGIETSSAWTDAATIAACTWLPRSSCSASSRARFAAPSSSAAASAAVRASARRRLRSDTLRSARREGDASDQRGSDGGDESVNGWRGRRKTSYRRATSPRRNRG